MALGRRGHNFTLHLQRFIRGKLSVVRRLRPRSQHCGFSVNWNSVWKLFYCQTNFGVTYVLFLLFQTIFFILSCEQLKDVLRHKLTSHIKSSKCMFLYGSCSYKNMFFYVFLLHIGLSNPLWQLNHICEPHIAP